MSKHRIDCLTSEELLERRRKKLPQLSMPNKSSTRTSHTVISDRTMLIKSRRRIGQISVHKLLTHLCRNTQESTLKA